MPANVICLLPVRNGAPDLPGFLSSIGHVANAIVALDDGSTDETAELLRTNKLVARVISNPRRPDFQGWNDAANRNMLLAAARDLNPDWIISIDADERISIDDARALREFLDHDALPGIAYGFRCYSMIGDLEHSLADPIWVYRLFAYNSSQRFPDQLLHFAPIPTSISRKAFLRTTFRIQHLGGMSPERRLARYEKYRQVDPECRFWPDYTSLLNEPGRDSVQKWRTRPTDAPVFFTNDLEIEPESVETEVAKSETAPLLAVIVLDDGSIAGTRTALASASAQVTSHRVEILLVTSRAHRFEPDSRCIIVTAPPSTMAAAMMNIGTRSARAGFVLFLDSTLSLLPGSLEAIGDAHLAGYASVTGSVEPAADDVWRQGVYLQRFGAQRRLSSAGILDDPPAWASQRRTLILEYGSFDESLRSGCESVLARMISAGGYLSYSVGRPVICVHTDQKREISQDLLNSFSRGVAESRFDLRQHRDQGEVLSWRYVRERAARRFAARFKSFVTEPTTGDAEDHRKVGAVASVLEAVSVLGQSSELIRPERNKGITLLGRPAGTVLVVVRENGRMPLVAIVRFDLRANVLKLVLIPESLRIPAASGQWISIQETVAATGDQPINRFMAQDLVGRPFNIVLDDLVTCSVEGLPTCARMVVRRVIERPGSSIDLRDVLPARCCLSILRAAQIHRGVDTTFGVRALLLGMLRLRAFRPEDIHVIPLLLTDQYLDADAVEMTRSFLDVEGIVRPATRRNRLRMVEWA